MHRQFLGISLLVILAALTLIPPLFGYPLTPVIDGADLVTPGPNDLNATDPIIDYSLYTPANPTGNSSLLDVIVERVDASDIGECKTGDLVNHTFGVYYDANDSLVFEADLQYISGTGWAALNYSLLSTGLAEGLIYKVRAFFARDTGIEIWNTTTAFSTTFTYTHSITIEFPNFTYIGDTSDTIDVIIEHISSSIWGPLTQANTTLIFQEADNVSSVVQFINVLQYNVSTTFWEVDELNISVLIPGVSYQIRTSANYSLRQPYHDGIGPTSERFTFQGPYLRVAQPNILYIGRDIQLLNITIEWVWHSIFGYLNETDVTLSNFSVYLASGSGALVNETLIWNSSDANWYFLNFNISYYIEQGIFTIGESYNVSATFHSPSKSGRPAVNSTSPFSLSFLIDRDPPSIDKTILDPSNPSDSEFVVVTSQISDDARIALVILSYHNGTNWLNLTMRGPLTKLANFTAAIPPLPEQSIIQYRIYAKDTQNAWANSTIQSYTVANTPPLIAYVSYLPRNPTDMDTVTVNATVTDGTMVALVELYYSYDGVIWSIPLEMVQLENNIYQVVIPRYPQPLPSYQFKSVIFRISAEDSFGNIQDSANYAYIVKGTVPAIDPSTSLLILAAIGLTIVVLIFLYKVYERY